VNYDFLSEFLESLLQWNYRLDFHLCTISGLGRVANETEGTRHGNLHFQSLTIGPTQPGWSTRPW